MRRALAVVFVAAAAAVTGMLVPPAGAAPVAHTGTIATYSDSVGEVAGAPDISSVTVSIEGDVLTIEAQVAGMPEPMSDGSVMFLLNTDANQATGKFLGADYILLTDRRTVGGAVMHWNGSDYVEAEKVADPSRSLIGGSSAGFMFNLANFGSPTHIEFSMMVLKGTADDGLMDVAPDSGLWAFDMPTPAPAPAPKPAPKPAVVKPVLGTPAATPATAVAGKRMTVTFRVRRSDNGRPLTSGRMICDPSVAGRVIVHAESFASGNARLSFIVPKTAKGKLLKVRVTIRLGAQSTTRIATFRVR